MRTCQEMNNLIEKNREWLKPRISKTLFFDKDLYDCYNGCYIVNVLKTTKDSAAKREQIVFEDPFNSLGNLHVSTIYIVGFGSHF